MNYYLMQFTHSDYYQSLLKTKCTNYKNTVFFEQCQIHILYYAVWHYITSLWNEIINHGFGWYKEYHSLHDQKMNENFVIKKIWHSTNPLGNSNKTLTWIKLIDITGWYHIWSITRPRGNCNPCYNLTRLESLNPY